MLQGNHIKKQLLISISLVAVTAGAAFSLRSFIDYRFVALILMLVVSVLAVSFDIFPVLVAAMLSALILNFLFLDPVLNYKIDDSEKALLFFIYISIALVNAVLTNRLRKQEKKVRDREEKEKTIRLYNTLFNSLSHELKTPIATVIGAVDTLKESDSLLDPAQKADLLHEIEIAGNRLSTQVENLLNMSRLESGNLRLKKDWTDVNELIFRVIRKVSWQGNEERVKFEPDERLPLFKFDAGLVETVLYSLVHNAMRYTSPGCEIEILTRYDDRRLSITVNDNGKGIPQEHLPRIFDKFYRVPGSGSGGSGLGLSIAKGFIEAHGGWIQAANRKTGGAGFTIVIPSEISYLKNLKNE